MTYSDPEPLPLCPNGACFIQMELGLEGKLFCRDCLKRVDWSPEVGRIYYSEVRWALQNAGKPSVDGRWDW